MLMYTFATITAQLFLAMSVGAPTAAADFIGSVVATPSSANANRRLQQVECVCSPTTYTFRLNFKGSCAVDTIQGNPGISGTVCSDIASTNDEDDLTLVQINNVQIVEVNDNLEVVKFDSLDGPFIDGESFGYTSISAQLNPDEPVVNEVPVGMQIELLGENTAGDLLISSILWTYDLTNCDAEPIMKEDAIGMIEVADYTSAIPAFCPAVETEPPTESPSESPVIIPPEPPTKSPVIIQSEQPTKSPVIIQPPTRSPTVASMSYAASFSLVYHSKAAKGKAHKTGKSKDGKLIRQRRV